MWIRATTVALGMGIGDFVWAKYIRTIATGPAWGAANWSIIVVLIGAFVVISYIEDKRMLIPACIGAWIGTYLSI